MKQNKAHFGFSGFIRKNGISNLLFDDSNDDEDDDVNDDYLRLLTAHPPPPSALSRRILTSQMEKPPRFVVVLSESCFVLCRIVIQCLYCIIYTTQLRWESLALLFV